MKKLNYFSIGFDYDEEKNPIMSFDSQSHCISEMYSGAFKPMVTKETSCIDINCIPTGKKVDKSHHLDAIYRVYFENKLFDLNKFNDENDSEKKKIILELLHIGAIEACRDLGLDKARFIEAYEKVKELDYQNNYYYKKPKSSPNRKQKAQIYIEHGLYKADIYIVIFNKEQKIMRKEFILSDLPNPFVFSAHLGNLKWIDNNRLVLAHKQRKDILYKVDII
ncbi:hypothetical protein ACU8IW_001260 [Listeria innocua]|uniref:hypothetical protein n=1 Tax=Listeria innocua TaxID=1642 RepID=UPI0005EFD882|nr:hypothetical protein [Listeria innocua]EAD5703639.1 hypothetical protein [Listeria innocua]EAD5709895.1 hypothetical protein [Listeria innocua]EAD5753301.1 hypothetical protein [Listeria innocua]EAE6207664.1 hypothetical protein [Listeria innocua]EAF5011443.1 hypothetical protein [Listeria innocua]